MGHSNSYYELLDVSYKLIAYLLMQTDLSKRRVSESEAKVWAETRGFGYFETSAQSGQGISEMFNVSMTLCMYIGVHTCVYTVCVLHIEDVW